MNTLLSATNDVGAIAALLAQIALLALLMLLSALFSGSEAALFSLTRPQLESFARSGNPLRQLTARMLQRPTDTLTIILVGNTTVNILLFASLYLVFQDLAHRFGAWVTPLAGVFSVLVVVLLCELTPKVVGVSLAAQLAPPAAWALNLVGLVLRPSGWLLQHAVAEPLARLLLGRSLRHQPIDDDVSEAELKALLEMSRRRGSFNRTEASYLREVIDLGALRVRGIMIPRVEMVAFDVNEPRDRLLALIREKRHKKIPVYDRSIDRIIGVIYAKVLCFRLDRPLRELVAPVHYVPELITCEQLLTHFRDTKSQLAIAVDEFGGIAGLVTLEDVLEQIVGEIRRPDESEGEPEIVAFDEDNYDVSGALSLRYWQELFDLGLRDERAVTVAGWVTSKLGRPAVVGDQVRLGNLRLTVTRVRGRRIERLRLHRERHRGETAA